MLGIELKFHIDKDDIRRPCPIFYKKQYIGHARYKSPYAENSIALYEYLVDVLQYKIIEGDVVFSEDGVPFLNHGTSITAFKDNIPCSIEIDKTPSAQLLQYKIHKGNNITPVEHFIKLGHDKGICIMLDLTFQHYTFKHLQTLYKLVKKYGMLNRTIWGDANIFKLAYIDRHLIYQNGGSWGRALLFQSLCKSLFCKQMIMSFSYYGGSIEAFKSVVQWGHSLGFLMKVATINDSKVAHRFWAIGTDLINTDSLLNYIDS